MSFVQFPIDGRRSRTGAWWQERIDATRRRGGARVLPCLVQGAFLPCLRRSAYSRGNDTKLPRLPPRVVLSRLTRTVESKPSSGAPLLDVRTRAPHSPLPRRRDCRPLCRPSHRRSGSFQTESRFKPSICRGFNASSPYHPARALVGAKTQTKAIDVNLPPTSWTTIRHG